METSNPRTGSWSLAPIGRPAVPVLEQVLLALRSAILDFKIKPGQRLVERELIEQLGVSRTSVRETLRQLAAEGLVTLVPRKGAIVATPTRSDAIDLYEVRATLESLVIQRFVERASDSQVDRLDAAVERFHDATIRTTDIREVLATKDLVYHVLIEGAGSAVLQQLLEGIQARVRVLRATSLSEAGRMAIAVDELRGIVVAIGRRDVELARQLTTEHIRSAAKTALLHMHGSE